MIRGPAWLPVIAAVAATACAALILAFDLHDNVSDITSYGSAWGSTLTWALRVTVSLSAPLFAAAFVARPLNELLHNRISRWMVKNRRYLGLSSAAFLLQHLWLLPLMQLEYGVLTLFLNGTNLFPAATILILATLLALTSTNAAQRALPGWKWLHWTGVQALWFWYMKAFFSEYVSRGHAYQLALLIVIILAQAVRIVAWAKRAFS